MAVPGRMTRGDGPLAGLRTILEMIKFEHTVFALPFALISVILAARRAGLAHGLPTGRTLGWVLVAMVAARSAAMAFNRIVDARYDAENPRTRSRAIPAGLLTAAQVTVFTVAAVALFEMAAWALGPLCLALSPVALLAILGYSYTKRFTSLAHLALGFAIGIAPVGAWIAVVGRIELVPVLLASVVTLWIGGFDIIYALQDVDYDRSAGLYSLPRRLGAPRALWCSRGMHGAMIGLLALVGVLSGLHWAYYAGVGVVAGLIVYEHLLVSPRDLSRLNTAFFTMNGWVSLSLLVFVVIDRLLDPS